MTTSRLHGRRGDGSAAVRGWVAFYTLGLPEVMRTRRRDEVTGDLADETLDAVRHGEVATLRRRRLVRLVLGIPDDLWWRLAEAPATARRIRAALPTTEWVPLSRRSMVLLAIAAIGAAGALAIMTGPILAGGSPSEAWTGWGPGGFMVGCAAVLAGVLASVPWPRRGLVIVLGAAGLGLAASPWLWGCWLLAALAAGVRAYEAAGGDLTP